MIMMLVQAKQGTKERTVIISCRDKNWKPVNSKSARCRRPVREQLWEGGDQKKPLTKNVIAFVNTFFIFRQDLLWVQGCLSIIWDENARRDSDAASDKKSLQVLSRKF